MEKTKTFLLAIIALALLPFAIPVLVAIVLIVAAGVYFAATPLFLIACAIGIIWAGNHAVSKQQKRLDAALREYEPEPIPDKSHGRNTDECFFSPRD